mmetsp:Transcript_19513/g.45392  ORF Transcript_19513/g.45392 Transcript_19513/m.45392 type:complete len:220 (+) Transcript_19513:391-1050(+)
MALLHLRIGRLSGGSLTCKGSPCHTIPWWRWWGWRACSACLPWRHHPWRTTRASTRHVLTCFRSRSPTAHAAPLLVGTGRTVCEVRICGPTLQTASLATPLRGCYLCPLVRRVMKWAESRLDLLFNYLVHRCWGSSNWVSATDSALHCLHWTEGEVQHNIGANDLHIAHPSWTHRDGTNSTIIQSERRVSVLIDFSVDAFLLEFDISQRQWKLRCVDIP